MRDGDAASARPGGFVLTSLFSWAILNGTAQGAGPITAAVFAPDGKSVVLGSQAGVEIRTLPGLEPTGKLATGWANVHDLKLSPDGSVLLVAGGSPAVKGGVEAWSWPEGKLLRSVAQHSDVVYRVAWSPDGARWATAGGDATCNVYAAASGERLARYEGHSRPVLAISFVPDGKAVISAGVDQTLRLWESATGTHLRTLDNHVAAVNDIALRPVGPGAESFVLASAGEDRTVRLWQLPSGRLVRFARLPSAPRAIAWTADGDKLVAGSSDGRVQTLAFETLEVARSLDGLPGRIHELAVAPSGSRWLVCGEGGTRVLALD